MELPYISFTMNVFKEGRMYVAHTPELDVSSCGYNTREAKKNLLEAVRGFLIAAAQMGTLNQILIEAGFTRKDKDKWVPPRHISTDKVSLRV